MNINPNINPAINPQTDLSALINAGLNGQILEINRQLLKVNEDKDDKLAQILEQITILNKFLTQHFSNPP